jgi:Zinc carboxypeptidase
MQILNFILTAGRELWVIAIGHSAKEHVLLQPEVKLIGNIHGDEVRSFFSAALFDV